MKLRLLVAACVVGIVSRSQQVTFAQTRDQNLPLQPATVRADVVAVNTNELPALPYDAGIVKFIATSMSTGGRSAAVELTEMPGYKTAWHQHNNCEEAFYVLEGTLTIKLVDKTYELPAGSYVFIPRGTPHAQGNFTARPVRLLTTFTPGGFDGFEGRQSDHHGGRGFLYASDRSCRLRAAVTGAPLAIKASKDLSRYRLPKASAELRRGLFKPGADG